jgi:hypothetical protein
MLEHCLPLPQTRYRLFSVHQVSIAISHFHKATKDVRCQYLKSVPNWEGPGDRAGWSLAKRYACLSVTRQKNELANLCHTYLDRQGSHRNLFASSAQSFQHTNFASTGIISCVNWIHLLLYCTASLSQTYHRLTCIGFIHWLGRASHVPTISWEDRVGHCIVTQWLLFATRVRIIVIPIWRTGNTLAHLNIQKLCDPPIQHRSPFNCCSL